MLSPAQILLTNPQVKRFLLLLFGWLLMASLTLLLLIVLWFDISPGDSGQSDDHSIVAQFDWQPPLTADLDSFSLVRDALSPDVPGVEAKAMILVDEESRAILHGRQVDTRLPMASTTKIMTAIVALEYGRLNSLITVDGQLLRTLPTDSTMMGISDGEVYTMEELLYGLLLASGNDASLVIASAISANEADFVELMNAKAAQLGLQDTHFTNSVGLDDEDHYSSVRDLAAMSIYARTFDDFARIVATPTIRLPYSDRHKELEIVNLNTMVGTQPGITGIKPGNTGQAGNCLVVSYEKNGRSYIGVLLDTPGRSTNMMRLLGVLD